MLPISLPSLPPLLPPTPLDPARYRSPMEVDRFPDLQAPVPAHRLISDRLAHESIEGLSSVFEQMRVSSTQFHSTNDRSVVTQPRAYAPYQQQHSHSQPHSISDLPITSPSAPAQTAHSFPTSSNPRDTINTGSSSRRRTAAGHHRAHLLSAVAAAHGHSHARLKVIKKNPEKKQTLACLFCRERKIACGGPPFTSWDQTCNQCSRRQLTCFYPTESRRGQHKRNLRNMATAPHVASAP